MTTHTCTAGDGTPIEIGQVLINNNLEAVKIVEEPVLYGQPCDGPGATLSGANCWWTAESKDGRRNVFDGSRLTTAFAFREGGLKTAEELWEEE